ncbi:site-specific DNA-methyltransferase [Sulfurihydrogenibium yellowstonense]|uniref:site-specific DNA-methyltransferase (adenine-specific) n=1 Tax=Sulfurihydrogenibium yellowstonense SS-5 TaxID=432331 RepID=C4FIM3_9AQUI|nr:site-specific DNA-methyltransferase [Sulfurihydrogenibium yellowstonense]EEP61081.1 modification methylase, type III R/M system [Sulfurihydrogenibium yellowstonense SS-5]
MGFKNELEKFQNLMKDLFQFEASDLDFGIYRILNYKREQIRDFIENRLKDIVESSFEKHKGALAENIDERFNRAKENVEKTLGKNAILPTGDLNESFKETPLGQEYLEVKEQKEMIEKIDEIKGQVYNDLYTFFSRYYEDGDFIPKYRYSIKGHKYAIPYNGEEVKLYWATAEQYYIKTGLLFRDYTFKSDNLKVIFRVVEAKDEIASNKATKERFFVLDDENYLEIKDNEIIVRFQYRELLDKEVKDYDVEGGSNTAKQEKINNKIFETLKADFGKEEKKLNLVKSLILESKNDKPLLLYHINRFTAKNTRDYFIHKNLKRFLSEQLDYFIKAEVLNYETLSQEKYLDKHITRAKTVKDIGEKVIEFLSQIEDFQKRLWEKKKFVVRTDYVITLDRIKKWTDDGFYEWVLDRVLDNSKQLEEWEELGFGSIRSKDDLKDKRLPIDTRYFDEEFKFRLLEKISESVDLEDALDGLLIKSENWQGLNTILNKYGNRVQTIYIDPPFNKEQDADYLYNVKYKDATWISMLENRLSLARELLNEKGSIFVRCDYNGNMYVRLLMNEIFGKEIFRNEIVVNRTKKIFTGVKGYNVATDSLFFFTKKEDFKFYAQYKQREQEQKWLNMHSPGERRPPERIIFGKVFYPPKGRHWTFTQETIDKMIKEGRIRIKEDVEYIDLMGNKVKGMPQYLTGEEELLDSNWTDIPGYSFGWDFQTENSEILLKRVIESTSNENDLVMDFFLGSGTTTAVAHKLRRKWIGIEMGEHFWTVIMPRMKKVLAYDKSGISKEKDVKEKYNEKTAGGFFKYQILEQYEDALDNIELQENQSAQKLFKDDYLIKYFLDYETRESPYLLNFQHLKNPFNYKLKINLSELGEPQETNIDIPETFNYLLGIKIKKIKKVQNEGKTYLFIIGEKDSKDYAIVWREHADNWNEEDYKKDKEFIKQQLKSYKPQVVYVNCSSILTPNFDDYKAEIRYIEPEFKALMES